MGNAVRKIPLPITNKNSKMALIHIAKNSVGITDEDYRTLLDGAAGIGSAAELEYEYQFHDVMKAFENLGFVSTQRRGTVDQRAKIEVMWKNVARNPSEKALRLFIKRIAHVDHPRFLTAGLAQKVIIALETMARKAGHKKEKK